MNCRDWARIGVACAVALVTSAQAPSRVFGTIDFPNSGAQAAQAAFLDGVKNLHSFGWEEAGAAFQQAQKSDPTFALAYWGEALSYNHPVAQQVDIPAAKRTLEKLAPTLEGRIAKAKTPKEQAFMAAVDKLFYTAGDKLTRDKTYSAAMRGMHERWPDDHEIAMFYAVSVQGTIRPGDQGFKQKALMASLAQKVFQENPNHPGAAHFIIHAFDDPDHALLGLPAALAYAKVAPSAAHALHMPSHIFVRLGMWKEVAASNTDAYKAAVDVVARLHAREGREDFHTLSWLHYANLMLGKIDAAQANVALAKAAMDRNPGNTDVADGYFTMRARQILETEQWERIPIEADQIGSEPPRGKEASEMPGMPGMAGMDNSRRYVRDAAWMFVAGYGAAKLGDVATAEKAEARLHALRERLQAGGDAYAAKGLTIVEGEVAAARKLAQGDKDSAVKMAKAAADLDLTMAPPSGPPEPIKPAVELYAEVLVSAGRAKDAISVYEQQLERTPNRTPAVKGLERARRDSGMMTAAAGR